MDGKPDIRPDHRLPLPPDAYAPHPRRPGVARSAVSETAEVYYSSSLGRLRMKFISALLVLSIGFSFTSYAQTLTSLSPQPEGVAWPTQGWETSEMPAGTVSTVTALISDTMSRELVDVMGETRAVVIIHKGRLVAEAYRDGFTPETKQISWSMAKSVTHALVGRAVYFNLIKDIDAPMPSPFAANDPRRDITWRQWLNMTDGLDYHEIDAGDDLEKNDVVQMMFGRGRFDVIQYIVDELPLIHAPGTHWNYSTAGFHLISSALARIITADVNALDPAPIPMFDFARMELFEPLGMATQIEADPAGTFLGGSLVWASPRDFAKFGYLYLRDGMWDGTRLLPEGWVDFARTKTPATNANIYGAGWWITAYGEPLTHAQNATTPPWDAFHAGGHEGQTVWIVPSRDLVIVRLGLMPNAGKNWPALYEWNQEIARAFPEAE